MSDELYDDDYFEYEELVSCPKCSRSYDEISQDFQYCKVCGWDAENEKWVKPIKPTEEDFMCGEANILTGWWY